MMQGQGASVLLRVADRTGHERYAEAARRAVDSILTPYEMGGVDAPLGDGSFPQEYPTRPPAHVLNGGIFALWGLYDVGVALGDATVAGHFERTVDCLTANLSAWDTGYWSRYDLFPHPLMNVATPAYHQLHIDQLSALNMIASRQGIAEAVDRFAAYRDSPSCRARAFSAKLAFRVRVPRNRLLARRVTVKPPAA